MRHVRDVLRAPPEPPARAPVLPYGRVFFVPRRRFGLSATEALLADVVATLSRRTGWCFASRQYLAELLGVSVRSVQRSVKRLKEAGLVERDGDRPRLLRPTPRWLSAMPDGSSRRP